jgi:predicted hotdog family 3-hydroxylacyl-ACP dehydratase
MPLTKTEICQFLPHDGVMCLLDSVEVWDDQHIICRAGSHRDPNNPLQEKGILSSINGVEYAAQAMGVHGGLVGQLKDGKPTIGYLASIRDLKLHVERLDDLPGDLEIEVRQLAAGDESVMCEFTLRSESVTLIQGRATLLMNAEASII